MATTIIYHEVKPAVPCPDGLAAAWVASKLYPNAQLVGDTYQSSDKLPSVSPGSCLVIVDFSYPQWVMNAWVKAGVEITVIDHHKTAMENLSGLSDRILAKFDMNECGATLAWKTFFPDQPMPMFLEYVRDRDLWNHALPMTEEIHEAMGALKRSFALFDVLEQMSKDDLIRFLAPLGWGLLKPKREKVQAIATRYQNFRFPSDPKVWEQYEFQSNLEISNGFWTVPVVYLAADGSEDRLTSDVCSFLYNSIPDAPFVACITSDGTWSLRSDKHGNNTDVGSIAKALGGGGHRNAAGFKP